MPHDDGRPPSDGRDYKDTLFLPDTAFPMRAGLPKREPELLARWKSMDLYGRLREDSKGRPTFTLHDGPPYANGHIHVGTALTKIIKDLVVRSHQMMGFDSNYVPGWDCHGLPIEWKVEEEFRGKGRAKRDVDPVEFRTACRAYADKWLGVQREEFQRLGGIGDWDNPYSTMDPKAEAAIAAEFLKFVAKGAVYRGSKPVMWSPVEQTSLAEAEIEYRDHVSTQIWVKFAIAEGATEAGADASVLIWTTTPWTIPGNRAICYSSKIAYGLYEVEAVDDSQFVPYAKPGEKLIVADALWDAVSKAAKISGFKRLSDVDPNGIVCRHPFHGLEGADGYFDFEAPLFNGDHVTDDAGTGFVHTAPGHGADDYVVWVANGYKDVPQTVGPDGAYFEHVPLFAGLQVIKTEGKKKGQDGPANLAVIDKLVEVGALLSRGRLEHSYPHSWRSKAPVIFRNTPQWFIKMDEPFDGETKTLRELSLEAIDATAFTPPRGRNRIRAMVETRPDWLVSRQRAWGVPLAIFVHKETKEILVDEAVNARIIEAFQERGADAWFDNDAAVFLSPDYDPDTYEKVEDILDVWFDSGSTHAFVLEGRDDLPWPADVYCEGSDQHRGWFQSSLLEGCGTRGRAPFRNIITNGFVMDGKGYKMSKSLGNVVNPNDVNKKFGAEILRVWAASSDYTDDLRIGDEILGSAVDAYRKIRNTIRYLLGGLADFSETERLPLSDAPELERYVAHLLNELDSEIRKSYQAFDFKSVFSKIFHFCTVDLSAFYFDIRKDALYCDHPDDVRRRACRTLMDEIFSRLTAWLAPICAFTMEEAWLARFPSEEGSVHLRQFPDTPEAWRDEALAAKWEQIRTVRKVVTGALEIERREKRIGASLEAAPEVFVADENVLKAFEGVDLAEIVIASAATLTLGEGPADAFKMDDVAGVAVAPLKAGGHKCARCWRVLDEVGRTPAFPGLCGRCADVVDRLDRAEDAA